MFVRPIGAVGKGAAAVGWEAVAAWYAMAVWRRWGEEQGLGG